MTLLATLLAGDLARIAAGAAKVAPKTSAIPILGTVSLRVGRTELSATATDLDQSISLSAQAKGHGAAVTSAHQLAAIAATLDPDSEVSLQLDGNILKVEQGKAKFKLPTLPTTDFPPAPLEDKDAITFSCVSEEFIHAATALRGIIDVDVARPYLSGLYLDATGPGPILVGCDGSSLGAAPISFGAPTKPPSIIIPLSALPTILSIVALTDVCEMWASSSAFGCAAEGHRFQTKIIDAHYPDWRRIIRKKSPTTLIVAMSDLRRLADRIHATGLPYARMEIGKTVKVSGFAARTDAAQRPDIADEFEPNRFDGPPVTVALVNSNLRWVIESYRDCDAVEFGLEGDAAPVRVTAPGRPNSDVRALGTVRA